MEISVDSRLLAVPIIRRFLSEHKESDRVRNF